MTVWPNLIVTIVLLPALASMFQVTSESPVPLGEGFVTTADGVELFYQKFGEGAQVVVAPGGMYLAGEFPRLAEARTVVLFDQRGRSRSAPLASTESLGIRYEVSDLEAVRQSLGFQRISLIGWSYMGLVVAKYALEHPDRVDRVIQVGPIPPRRFPYLSQYQQELTRRHGVQNTARLEELIQLSKDSSEPAAFIRPYYEVAHKALFYGPVVETGFRSDFYKLANETPYNVWRFQLPAVIDSLSE